MTHEDIRTKEHVAQCDLCLDFFEEVKTLTIIQSLTASEQKFNEWLLSNGLKKHFPNRFDDSTFNCCKDCLQHKILELEEVVVSGTDLQQAEQALKELEIIYK